ncbi:MAG: AbrB family transcriptional regulator [Aestuariibacter sp.]|nr:AbrB family transcriptional regulator [Aestuariibacter sp.]
MQTNIRKWGNSAGAIIPVGALAKAGIKLGDTVELNVREGEIVLKQTAPKYTLSQLLETSSDGAFDISDEDREWLQDSPLGREQA